MHLVAPQLSLGRRRSRTIQTRTHGDWGSLPYNDLCVDSCGRGWQELELWYFILENKAQFVPEPNFSEPKSLLQWTQDSEKWLFHTSALTKTVILETCWPSQKVESSNICDKDKLRRGGAAALLFFLTWHLPTSNGALSLGSWNYSMKVISSKRCDKENQAIMSADIYHQWRSVSSNCSSIVLRVLHPAIICALFGVALALEVFWLLSLDCLSSIL